VSKYTPAPWFVDEESPPRILANDERHTIIAVTTAARSNPTNMADAHLIAAAPELLEALKRIKETRVFLGAIPQEMMDNAIAKAEGLQS
jgi:hypothetical protein